MKEAAADRIVYLRQEHQLIANQLNLLMGQISTLAGSTVQAASLVELRKTLSTFGLALKSHFDYEERGLYRPLEASLGKDSPTGGMVDEHRAIYRAFQELVGTLSKYEIEPTLARHLKTEAGKLQRMMSEHIVKEEKVLFWIAEVKL